MMIIYTISHKKHIKIHSKSSNHIQKIKHDQMMLISQKYISLVFLRHIITTPLGMLSPSNPPIRDDLMYFRSGSQSLPRGLPSKSHAFRSDSGHWRRLDFRWRSWWLNEWISDWSICFIFRFIKLILFGLILVVFNPLEKKCCHNVVKCRIFFLKKKSEVEIFCFSLWIHHLAYQRAR